MNSQAPGSLDLVRRFLNTVSFERGQDPLNGPDALPDWCREAGVRCGEEALPRLRRFREALRAVGLANAGHGDPEAGWATIEPFFAGNALQVRLEPGPVLAAAPEAADPAIAELLAILYDALKTGEFKRLKVCRASDCLWAFYDRSKNGSGEWCSMAGCGNRAKARRRRQRTVQSPKVAGNQGEKRV